MAPLTVADMLPLFSVTLEDLRASMDADANAGRSPADEGWTDLTVGGHFFDLTQVVGLQIEKVWDAVSYELPAACFVATAWGEYLDLHGQYLKVPRKDAATATGVVRFVVPDGTLIAEGTEVGVSQQDPAADELLYAATADRTVHPLGAPAQPTATATTGGTLTAGTKAYVITALNANGETTHGVERSVAVGGGGTNAVDLAWDPLEDELGGAEPVEGYRVYRGNAGGPYALIGSAAGTTFTDDGSATPGAAPPVEDTTGGSALVPVAGEEPGGYWNIAAGSISLPLTPIEDLVSVTNPEAITGGADAESDESYVVRLLLESTAERGGGTVADYKAWCLGFPGVGAVNVEISWDGAGTIRCTVLDEDRNPVSAALVDALKLYLDPLDGAGGGQAPANHVVTVATPTSVTADLAGTIEFEDGYSLDGADGSIALRGALEGAYAAYVDGLLPGADVLLNRAEAALLSVDGVYDVSGVELDGVAADFTVGPTQVAVPGTVTLA